MIYERIEADRASAAGACWIVLTTASARTLKLARSLADAGFRVWTPLKLVAPRKSGSQQRHDPFAAAMMPGFVFARAYQTADLRAATRLAISPHPMFQIFQPEGQVPVLADTLLDPIRTAERDALIGKQHSSLSKRRGDARDEGDAVAVPGAAFVGQPLVVEKSDDRMTTLRFGSMRMKIETFQLGSDLL